MATAEGKLSVEMRAAIGACARGVARGLEALAEREAAMLRVVQGEREAVPQALAEREAETNAGREALAAVRAALDSEIPPWYIFVKGGTKSNLQRPPN